MKPLSTLPHADQVAAILTADDAALVSAWATRQSRRASPRPKVLRPCPRCGKQLGAREMRQHTKAVCPAS